MNKLFCGLLALSLTITAWAAEPTPAPEPQATTAGNTGAATSKRSSTTNTGDTGDATSAATSARKAAPSPTPRPKKSGGTSGWNVSQTIDGAVGLPLNPTASERATAPLLPGNQVDKTDIRGTAPKPTGPGPTRPVGSILGTLAAPSDNGGTGNTGAATSVAVGSTWDDTDRVHSKAAAKKTSAGKLSSKQADTIPADGNVGTRANTNTRLIGFPFDPAHRRGIAVPKPTGTGDVNGNGLGAQTIDGAVGLPLNPTATPSKRSKASNTATKGDGGN